MQWRAVGKARGPEFPKALLGWTRGRRTDRTNARQVCEPVCDFGASIGSWQGASQCEETGGICGHISDGEVGVLRPEDVGMLAYLLAEMAGNTPFGFC